MSNTPTPRREFLGLVAASAIVLAGTACAAPASVMQTVAAPVATPGNASNASNAGPASAVQWDDSWFGRLTAKHKAVFDSPDFEDGIALSQASGYIRGMREAVGAGVNDVQTVVVVRHRAVPMAFNDAMWAKYNIGEERKVKDSSDKWATRNPFIGSANGGGRNGGGNPDRPQSNMTWLLAHGHVVLACDLATHGFAGTIAQKTKGDAKAIYEELKANLVPGVILQPTGVYAVHRAQEAGCTYIKSS
jgi:hypothetical protein